jgi:hypothetical protein
MSVPTHKEHAMQIITLPRLLLLLLGFSQLGSVFAEDESVRNRLSGLAVSVGLEYEQGDYGTPYTTKLWRIPFGLSYSADDYSVGVSVPYLSAKSTGSIVVSSHGGSHMTSSHASSTAQSAAGLGDITGYASYYLTNQDSNLETYVTARIKLGTADEKKGLGTGGNDYSLEFSAEKTRAKQTYFGTVGYQITGDAAGIVYDNVLYGDVGIKTELSNSKGIGAAINYSQAAVAGADDYLDLTGFVTTELDKQRDVYFYVQAGLSNAAPDLGIGVNLRYAY